MMRFSKRLTGVIVLSLLLGSLIPASLVFAQSQADEVKARAFIKIAENAKEQAARLRTLAVNRGLSTAASDSLVAQGEPLLVAANEAFTAASYGVAVERSREAADKYREAIKTLGLSVTGEGETPEDAGKGLLVAISRAEDRIQRLQDVLNGLPAGTPEALKAAVTANLTAAQEDLDAGQALLAASPPDVLGAAQKLASANRKIADAFAALRAVEGWVDSWRSEAFLQGIKQLVDRIQEIVDRLPTGHLLKARFADVLTQIEGLLLGARSDLQAGKVQDALAKVKEARDLAHGAFKEVNKAAHKP